MTELSLWEIRARAGPRAEEIARAAAIASGEDPDAFHTRADLESGLALPDHAIPLWRQSYYYSPAFAHAVREAQGL